jgi:hypothetical protein
MPLRRLVRDALDRATVRAMMRGMDPPVELVSSASNCRPARRWWVVGGLLAAIGGLALALWHPVTPKLHPQIVLHPELKTGGPLATISYGDCIRASMGKVEGYPVSDKRMIRPYFHPFLLMLHLGFASHRPVSISPDAVWLMICNGFATHAEVRGDGLQRKLFPQGRDGKVTIKVRRDGFRKGENNDWEGVFGEFAATMDGIMDNHLKATLTDGFSTTGAKEKAAFEVVFMKTLEQSFGYEVATVCGIPSITLEGTVQDWENLAARAEKLRGYDCDWWLDALKPVLAQFTAAAGGKVDRDFWRSIYKVNEQSGGDTISGWCLLFFPYVKAHDLNGDKRWEKNAFLLDAAERELKVSALIKLLEEDPFMVLELSTKMSAAEAEAEAEEAVPKLPGLFLPDEPEPLSGGGKVPFVYRSSDFGSSIVRVPFVWEHLGTKFDMVFLAGFCGVSYDPETELLRAEIGWGVKDPGAGALPEQDIWKEFSQNVRQSGKPAVE